MNPRRGQHTPHKINGDPADLAGFPRLVDEFAEWMGVHGYSPRTIENRRAMLSFLVDWLAERGVPAGRGESADAGVLPAGLLPLPQARRPPAQLPVPVSAAAGGAGVLQVATRAHHLLHNPRPRRSTCPRSNSACPDRPCRKRRRNWCWPNRS